MMKLFSKPDVMLVLVPNGAASRASICAAGCGEAVVPIEGWLLAVEKDRVQTDKLLCVGCVKRYAPDAPKFLELARGEGAPDFLRRWPVGDELADKLAANRFDLMI